jgi:hypothetical protein
MIIIEVDSVNVKPLRVDSIQIFAGKPIQGHSPTLLTDPVKKKASATPLSYVNCLSMIFERRRWLMIF